MLQFSQNLNKFLQDDQSSSKRYLGKKKKQSSNNQKISLPLKTPIHPLGSTINFTA